MNIIIFFNIFFDRFIRRYIYIAHIFENSAANVIS
jgi:hypothetical protein